MNDQPESRITLATILRRHPREWPRSVRYALERWRQGLTFLLGGCVVGLAGVGMAVGATMTYDQFERLRSVWPLAPLIITPLGFAAIAWVTRRWFPNGEGSGIPQAIAARKLWGAQKRGKLVSLRLGIGKFFLTLAGLLIGASIGREGPTVQVGASVMFALGRLSPRLQPGLILAGASAGVAAAFNTPLAGVIFGIEEMSRSFDERTNGLVIGTIVAAGIVSVALLGNYTYFGVTAATLGGPTGWLAVPVCGVAGGLLGGCFSMILVKVAAGLPGRVGAAIRGKRILFALACGIMVAICGLLSGGTIFGTGYPQIKALMIHGTPLPWTFAPLKFAATALSSIAGIPGGLFSPSLAVGGGIGYDVAQFFPGTPVDAIVLLGMVGYFSGVVQAPITAFAIVAEMTADNTMIVPLMASSLIAMAASRLVCSEGVYQILSHNYLKLIEPGGEASAAAEAPATRQSPG